MPVKILESGTIIPTGPSGSVYALNAANSATQAANSATSAASSSAAAGTASGRLIVGSFAELLGSKFTYGTPGAGEEQVAEGDVITWAGPYFAYEVLASGATDQDLTTADGVKLRVLTHGQGYNVLAFGATGDAVTDDAAAIQAAIDRAKRSIPGNGSELTGAVVYFPAGHYYVNTNLDLTANAGVSLVGDGGTKSTLRGGAAVTRLLDFSGGNNYRGVITGMRLTGGIGGALPCIAYVYGGGNQIHFVENWIDSAGIFIDTNGMADCKVINNTFEFVRTPFAGVNYYDFNITGNMFYGNGPVGTGTQPNPFNFENSYRLIFADNKIIWDRALGISTADAMINVSTARNVTITGNIIYDRPGSTYPMRGVRVVNSQRVIVANNNFGRFLRASVEVDVSQGVVVSGNQIIGCTNSAYWPITVQGDSADVVISENSFRRDLVTDYSNLANTFDIFLNGSERVSITDNKTRLPIYVQSNNARMNISGNHMLGSGAGLVYAVFPPSATGKEWRAGDYIPAAAPTAGGYLGLVCVTTGTTGTASPPVFKGAGLIES